MSFAMKYQSFCCPFIVQTAQNLGTNNGWSTTALNEDFSKSVTCQFNILYFRATDIRKVVFTAN